MSSGNDSGPSGRGEVTTAVDRGVAFLAARLRADGELPVFAGATPDPAVFPTAIAAHALAFVPSAARVHNRALDFLEAEMDARGLWRHWPARHPYHAVIPPDLDDTACASAVLVRAGRRPPGNRARLLANRAASGLFRTWVIGAAEVRHPLTLFGFFRQTSATPFDVDAVVNANVLHYLGRGDYARPVIDHLTRVLQDGRESQCDKWYENPFAVWYFFSRALRVAAPECGALLAARLKTRQPACALEAALAVCVHCDWHLPCDVDAILRAQLSSGGWPSAALYHGGRMRRRDGSFAPPHPDTPHWGSEELTTALCLEALSRCPQAPEEMTHE